MNKKSIIFAIILWVWGLGSIVYAGQYSWVKGGTGFGNTDFVHPKKSFENGEVETSRDWFVAVSPISVRKHLPHNFGLRIEPYGFYSENDIRLEQPKFIVDGEQKQFGIGSNLFLDYEITPTTRIYGGGTMGVEISEIEADIESIQPNIRLNTGISFNGYMGAEAGVEHEIMDDIWLGGFWRFTNPDSYQDKDTQLKYDHDLDHQIGLSLTTYW